MRSLLSSLVLAGFAACAPQPPHATALDAERAHVALDQLTEGRGLLLEKCGACHRAPLPTAYRPLEWPKKLDEMAERSKLDGRQRHMIEQYLVVMSERPIVTATR